MGRGFLECFQKSIEGLQGQHVRFVDDVDFEAALGRKKYMRPLEDHEIPLVKASVKQVQGAGIN